MSQPHSPSATLRVVVGPTAAGKSAIAMTLAERYGLGIVSADSRQIYRGFDIGTAKPTADERARVPHAGLDVCEPSHRYSAHQWAADADRWMQQNAAQGRRSIVVGGTGFYIRSLVSPLDEVPALESNRRAELASWLDSLDPVALERWCLRLDPARASLGRTQRLRAVETALLSGRRLSDSLHTIQTGNDGTGTRAARYLVVDPGTSLAGRIEARVDQMFAHGWVDEVERLMRDVPMDAPAWKASGYAAVRELAIGRGTRAQTRDRVVIETRQYAKRQRTWNRHQLPIADVTTLDSSAADAIAQACAWWEFDDGRTA